MMKINEVLKTLRAAPSYGKVYFDFGGCFPTTIDSWRGIYAEPAIGWDVEDYDKEAPSVESLKRELECAIDGRNFTGWKGGEYSYTGNETLHIDNPGRCTNTEIMSASITNNGDVILHTGTERFNDD